MLDGQSPKALLVAAYAFAIGPRTARIATQILQAKECGRQKLRKPNVASLHSLLHDRVIGKIGHERRILFRSECR